MSSTRLALVALVVVAALAAFGIVLQSRREPVANAAQVRVSGAIEGAESDVAAKASGRIRSVLVRDGASVKRGQLLLVLDDPKRDADLKVASVRLADALKAQAHARKELASLAKQMAAAPKPPDAMAPAAAPRANPALAAARAEYELAEIRFLRARADFDFAQSDRDRLSELAKTGDVSETIFERSQSAFEAASEALSASKANVVTARADLAAARVGSVATPEPVLLESELAATQEAARELRAAQVRLAADRADALVVAARARYDEARAAVGDLNVDAPTDGVVVMRGAAPGATVSPGQPLLALFDPGSLYLHGFVQESDVARIRVGQAAQVFLNGAPDRPLPAHVSEVDFAASLQSGDRTHPAFGVRIALDRPSDAAKPNVAAYGVVDLAQLGS
jgi:HlyD family secretion protein